jgi:L-serine dehydratase
VLDWVNLYALAVNEENAAGGRVVTAPTNGAAGIVPAVLHYYTASCPAPTTRRDRLPAHRGRDRHPLQGERQHQRRRGRLPGRGRRGLQHGRRPLCAVLGGTPAQVENAAEIGMEHNLGLTCDPVGGLVQIPCIERNAMASVKAINAARMALRGDGTHFVSLDKVIKTMRDTGADMMTKYKETARGGLAVNIVEC